jgi:putative PEP-CTERM system histidine kinase
MAALAALLLSDRARKRLNVFVGSHFGKAQHDSVQVWTSFSRRLASVKDESDLAQTSARLISETFDALSVTVWLMDDGGHLTVTASTAPRSGERGQVNRGDPQATAAVPAALRERSAPFDMEGITTQWATQWRELNPASFPNGGNRWTVPLRAGDRLLGAVVLADRVSGRLYTSEDIQLLQCVADQMTSVLLNLRLGREVAAARELEALNTMSAFFVHDLKNAAASLNLMLRNLPVHFDDPAFRADAIRAIGNTTGRIEDMIVRLSSFRQGPALSQVPTDLNALVCEALEAVGPSADVELTRDLGSLPKIAADRDQLRSVVTNLVLNARDALETGGAICVRTAQQNGRVVLSVSDNGTGMSAAFVKEQLFRPFQSTKKKGLGIGLFQCRAIVQAHGGGIHAESEPGRGTTFVVTLPVAPEQ